MIDSSKRTNHAFQAAKAAPTCRSAPLARRKRLLMLSVALILPGAFSADEAQAACAPGTLCVTQAVDTGNIASIGSFSWAINQANAGGNQIISFDSAVFSGANTTLTLSGTNVQTPRVRTPGIKGATRRLVAPG